MTADPGFVLVHGAGLGSWIWESVIPLLGHPALAVDLPGRAGNPAPRSAVGMHAAVRAVTADASAWDDRPLVLVGHSLGGMVALGVTAALRERVRAVVLVGGAAAPSGTSYFAALPPRDRVALRVVARLRIPAPRAALRRVLCNDLDSDVAARVTARASLPEPRRMYAEPVTWDTLHPSTSRIYVKLLRDRAVPPALQDRFAANLGRATVVTLDTGHLPMFGRPDELADELARTLA